jgi:hypothetical protein
MRRTWLLALALVVACGCTRQRQLPVPTPKPIRGKITWKGEPVRYAIVNFDPVDGHGAEADGCTGEDGTFELRSFANDGSKDGVLMPARYKVVLEVYDPNRLVAIRPLPPGAMPTPLPGYEWETGEVEVQEGDTEINIVIP